MTQGIKYEKRHNHFSRRITIEITQKQALNLPASIASDFLSAVEFMPEDFRKRHQELFNLLLAQLPDEEKTHVL